jgi:hypothetical protein
MADQSNSDVEVAHYTCYRTRAQVGANGLLDDSAWEGVPRSPRFVDVVSGAPALYDSFAAALWDEGYLHMKFWSEEPFVRAALTERDSLIFMENDIEVFIDGGDTYYEFEINALGTIYEVFYIWKDAYERGGRFDVPEFDVFKTTSLTFGGNHDRSGNHFWWGTHPRKLRWAFLDWDFPGLKTAVHVDGKINDPTVIDKGWTVTLAFPWSGMKWLADGRSLPPQQGDVWRIFFGRYQKMDINGQEIHAGWAWNRVGSGDNHRPECFTQLHFSESYVEGL